MKIPRLMRTLLLMVAGCALAVGLTTAGGVIARTVPTVYVALSGYDQAVTVMACTDLLIESEEETVVSSGAEFYAVEFGGFPDLASACDMYVRLRPVLPAGFPAGTGRILARGDRLAIRWGVWKNRSEAAAASQAFPSTPKPEVVGIRRTWRTIEGIRIKRGEEYVAIPGSDPITIGLRGAGSEISSRLPLRLSPAEIQPQKSTVRLNTREYPGSVDFRRVPGSTGLAVFNRVETEDYLPGVLLGEMHFSWPAEALKAQAVACRSNTVLWVGRHALDGYDMCDGTHCQVYRGATLEPRLLAAVTDTAGQVIQYAGKTVAAYFHSSSGGRTENNEDVWPGTERSPARPLPYLRSVPDYDEESPYYVWTVIKYYTVEELARLLKVEGDGPLTIAPLKGANGVPVRYRIWRDPEKARQLTREEIRNALGLLSPRMTFNPVTPERIAEALQKLSLEGPAVLNGVSRGNEALLLDLRLKLAVPRQPVTQETVIPVGSFIMVDGRGYGHGIGMSQWGAKAMAEKGSVYPDILRHYYQGIQVEQIY